MPIKYVEVIEKSNKWKYGYNQELDMNHNMIEKMKQSQDKWGIFRYWNKSI